MLNEGIQKKTLIPKENELKKKSHDNNEKRAKTTLTFICLWNCLSA